jgi:hypothetical protein
VLSAPSTPANHQAPTAENRNQERP